MNSSIQRLQEFPRTVDGVENVFLKGTRLKKTINRLWCQLCSKLHVQWDVLKQESKTSNTTCKWCSAVFAERHAHVRKELEWGKDMCILFIALAPTLAVKVDRGRMRYECWLVSKSWKDGKERECKLDLCYGALSDMQMLETHWGKCIW